MASEILLPYKKAESLGRLLSPANDSPILADVFDGLRSVYRTADDLSVSFVTKCKHKDVRLTMSLPDFIVFIMNNGRPNPNQLNTDELTSLSELGFKSENIEESIAIAISFNNLNL